MKALLLGNGGHARVVSAMASSYELITVEKNEEEAALKGEKLSFLNGIGVAKANLTARINAFNRFKAAGFTPLSLVSKAAIFEGEPTLHKGCQVMAGAIIQTNVTIHENVVINTGASIDHDCVIHAHAFISPRATLCGGVTIGEAAFLGAGCIIFPNVSIKANAIIPAGSIIKK